MRAYGLSLRDHDDVDVVGIKQNGRPTRFGHVPCPGGDTRAMQTPAHKAAARRTQKRVARAEGKAACREVE